MSLHLLKYHIVGNHMSRFIYLLPVLGNTASHLKYVFPARETPFKCRFAGWPIVANDAGWFNCNTLQVFMLFCLLLTHFKIHFFKNKNLKKIKTDKWFWS